MMKLVLESRSIINYQVVSDFKLIIQNITLIEIHKYVIIIIFFH